MTARWGALLVVLIFPASLAAGVAEPAPATGASTEYVVDFWQEDTGLPQKFVNFVRQARTGHLWIGTRGGLARFDGVGFEVFDDRDPSQLAESEVIAFAEAPDGSVWIGTHEGGLSHFKDGRFRTYQREDGVPHNVVTALAMAPDGTLWVGTVDGLAHYAAGQFTRIATEGSGIDDRITALHFDAAGTLWIGTIAGLATYTQGRLTPQADVPFRVMDIAGDGKGTTWTAAYANGLVEIRDGRARRYAGAEGLKGSVSAVCVDLRGRVWAATQYGVFRREGNRFEPVRAAVTKQSGNESLLIASLRRAQALMADAEGSIWVGTAMDGLARLREATFTNISVGEVDGADDRASSILEDGRGDLWVGVESGGLVRLRGGEVVHYPLGSKPSVDTLFEDRAGVVWAGNETGLYRLKGDTFVRVATEPNTFSTSVVAADGTIWIGTRGRGLFQLRDGALIPFGAAEGLAGKAVRAVALDPAGRLWVGTKDAGVSVLVDGRFVNYSVDQGLASPSVAALHVDADGVAWVATRRGLSRIRDGQVSTFTAQQGLPANFFYQIVEDGDRHLWMTFGRGVVRVSKDDLHALADGRVKTVSCRTFGAESGMKSTSMVVPNHPTAWPARDGRIWFATGRGVTVVDPRSVRRNEVVPPTWVEEIRADYRAYPPRDGLRVPPGDGNLEIHYAGLSYVAPERVRFKYRLEGLDDTWVDAGTRRVAYYTHLPPGRYRFVVQACNNDGVWNHVGHAITFELQPHWYQTQWFAGAMSVGALLALAGAYRWRVRAHHQKEQELARRVDEALVHVKTLRGLLPICAGCKKIRDDSGYWNQMETYIQDHSEADFSHGMCPDCISRMYPDYAEAERRGARQV